MVKRFVVKRSRERLSQPCIGELRAELLDFTSPSAVRRASSPNSLVDLFVEGAYDHKAFRDFILDTKGCTREDTKILLKIARDKDWTAEE